MLSSLFETVMTVLVQGMMLFHVSLSYLVMWAKHRGKVSGYEAALELPGRGGEEHPLSLSIIIPAYREKRTIAATLRRLLSAARRPDLMEIVVVDAGGGDGTMDVVTDELKKFEKRKVAKSTGGRGPAVTAGATIATGDLLLVVHADTLLPEGFDDLVRVALAKTPASAFAFKVNRETLDGGTCVWPFRIMEEAVRIRATTLQLPFGDQAIGVTKTAFQALGGFDDLATLPILEDYVLVQRLRILGVAIGRQTITEIAIPAPCDGRRWLVSSVWKNNLLNQRIMLLYNYAGYTPQDLFQLYYGKKVSAA